MNNMFTTSCFIRKNTPELRKKLEELGYKNLGKVRYYGDPIYIYCENDIFYTSPCKLETHDNYRIDCGTNEELFLAIATLRDDTDKNQWLTDGKIWGKFGEDSFLHPIQIINYLQSKGHKATIEEIIEHFKDK